MFLAFPSSDALFRVVYSEEELRERNPLDITHPDDRELTAEYRRQLFAGERAPV